MWGVVGQFEKAACTPPVGVILSVAAFQAERRISRLTGPARTPNCTTTEIQNLRKFKTLHLHECRQITTVPFH
jgi:hypothetical protein